MVVEGATLSRRGPSLEAVCRRDPPLHKYVASYQEVQVLLCKQRADQCDSQRSSRCWRWTPVITSGCSIETRAGISGSGKIIAYTTLQQVTGAWARHTFCHITKGSGKAAGLPLCIQFLVSISYCWVAPGHCSFHSESEQPSWKVKASMAGRSSQLSHRFMAAVDYDARLRKALKSCAAFATS